MSKDFSDMKAFTTAPFAALAATTASSAKGLQAITAEMMDYSTKSFEKSRVLFEKLITVKKIGEAIQLQSDFTKSAYEDYIAQATKIGEIYARLAKEAFNIGPSAHPSVAAPSSITAAPSVVPPPSKSRSAGNQDGSYAG